MKLLKILVPVVTLAVGALIVTTPNTSCTKKQIIHDTTIVNDTVTIHDTVGCCNINSDMIAYYTFTGGSLKDSSGLNNDISFNSATKTTDRFGNANGAYLFDGSTSYMKVTNSASLSPAQAITIMAIVKINGFWDGPCHANQILGKGTPDNIQGWYSFRFGDYTSDCLAPTANPNYEKFGGSYGDNIPYGIAAATGTDTVIAKTGQWYTLVFTYNGSVANYYVNGQLKDSRTATVTFNPNTHDVYIGRHEDNYNGYWFNGVIDEVRIYNKALCTSAVQQLSKLGSTGTGL